MANVELDPAPPEKRPDQTPAPRTSAQDAASIPDGKFIGVGGDPSTKGATQQGGLD